jgi:hypothetical protein
MQTRPISNPKLTPEAAPGRPNRKARAFASEIVRLQGAGFSAKAIRDALAQVDVLVSESTVRREMARHPRHVSAFARETAVHPPSSARPPGAATGAITWAADTRSGKDVVEEFMRSRVTNPLALSRDST